MYSATGDYIGQGRQQVFTPAGASITVGGNAGDVLINVNQGGYQLEFSAVQGRSLQPGVYDGATRAPFRTGAEPGIDISGDGRGCNTDQGRFEVKDIHVGSSGVPDRLWLVYEQHCEGGVNAVFGEVRINEPSDNGSGSFVPGLVRWPVDSPGAAETVIPVQFLASEAGTLGRVSLGGGDPGDFTIREDDCGGQIVTAGGVCDIYVRFVPTQPGVRTATLDLTDSAGSVHSIPLQGWTYGGTTRLVMNSDPGDWIGGGQSYDFTPPSHQFAASGDRNGFSFNVDDLNWTGSFHPGQGDIFTAGTTYNGAQRDAFRGAAPGMEVDGPGRGCNTVQGDFQVLAATFDPDGKMETFAVKFDQHCEGDAAALHGEFDWRKGDTTPRAPWMGPGPPCSPPSCNDTNGSEGGTGETATGTGGATSGNGSSNSTTSTLASGGSSSRDAGAAPGRQPRAREQRRRVSLRAEQHALAGHGPNGLSAALRVAARNAAKERAALAILAGAR